MFNSQTAGQSTETAVAIVGMSGRFPGASNLEEFWRNLCDGVESITRFSDEELAAAGISRAMLDRPDYVKMGAPLQGVDLFDAAFFGFTPREAELTDPQQRLFLECAWEALESVGYSPESYAGRIGVYAGVSTGSYLANLYSHRGLVEKVGRFQIALGNDKDYLSTRTSYKLDLRGPSLTVQTACSTSLVAVHLACQSLIYGECDMALAGGATVTALRPQGYLYQDGMIVSPDGHCRAFDAQAQGTIFGDGVGVVVLKRLKDALSDGDPLHAVIRGSAINNDGALKLGYTAPSVEGQAGVVAEALAVAGVAPEEITYVEAHGTATLLGDPVEVAALTEVFRTGTEKKGFCAIGSVKTNIGHLDITAGVAGLLKVVLALKHRQLPPSLHFTKPNPRIDFANSPFHVNTQLREWNPDSLPRRAGVSSLGIGGTNAHVIIEEAPAVEASGPARSRHLLILSAKTATALEIATANLATHLRQHREVNLADVAYTLQAGRHAFNHRRALVCHEVEDAVRALEARDAKRVGDGCAESQEPPVVFMFPGQGTQHPNMGRELYETEPVFRDHVDHCSELLGQHLGCDLREVLYPADGRAAAAAPQLQRTEITQPALFVVEHALARLWMEWGVRPRAMIGHSVGEYVAACLSGVLTLEDALGLVALRGRLIQQQPEGAMLGVALAEQELLPLLDGQLSLAAHNTPSLCVVSGAVPAVEALQSQLAGRDVNCWRLHTSHAFHSAMMEPVLEPFTEQVRKVSLRAPQTPYLSNVTGTWVTAAEVTDPHYWSKHLRHTVRFAEGLRELLQEEEHVLLEVGPGHTLSALAKRHPEAGAGRLTLSSLPHPHEQESEAAFALGTLGQLWLAGVRVDWAGLHAGQRRHRLPLPTYPFERQRYWIEHDAQAATTESAWTESPAGSLRAAPPEPADWFYAPSWRRSLLPARPSGESRRRCCWLIFLDECAVGLRLATRLEEEGEEVVVVRAGPKLERQGERAYALNPGEHPDYETLIAELCARGQSPQKIVHLWGVTPDAGAEVGLVTSEAARGSGFYSLLWLAQACGASELSSQLYVVTNNLHEVTGEEAVCAAKATALGPLKVIPQEYPQLTCRGIDLLLPAAGARGEQMLLDQLLTELTTDSADKTVAYRGRHRWVQTFEPLRLVEPDAARCRLRARGTYLITGGLGGLGLILAEYLAKSFQARLILAGRSDFPARGEWDNWLGTHDGADGISRKIGKVREFEASGAEVLVVSADVADEERMREVVAQAQARFGQVHGVIHAAGSSQLNLIQHKTREEAESVLRPKVKGTQVLDAIFKDARLDFLLLCSSQASLLGAFGQVDYCAANAFLDAYAHGQHSTRAELTVSVNWDVWPGVGMAARAAVPPAIQAWRAALPQTGIRAEEGVEAVSRILQAGLPQVVVSTQNFLTLSEQQQALEAARRREAVQRTGPPRARHQRPALGDAYVAPRGGIEQRVADIWQEVLGIEQVGVHDNFFALGGDSLFAIQIISRLQEAFPVKLPLHRLFTAPTIAQLAEAVEELLTERLEALTEDEAQRLITNISRH